MESADQVELRARAAEWMGLLSSTLHPTFIGFFSPRRYTDVVEVHAALERDCRRRFFRLLEHVDRRLPEGGFVMGDRFSLCDPYAALFFMLGRFFGFPIQTLPRYAALFARVSERPSFKKAFAREGIARIAESRARASG